MFIIRGLAVLTAALTFILGPHAGAQVQKMDLDTNSLVIAKFEEALKNLSKTDPTRSGVANRLGDLYSDRARLKEFEEGKRSCQNCLKSKEDRLKAISYYSDAYPHLTGSRKESVLVQLAHLYILTEQEKKSEQLYKGVLANRPVANSRDRSAYSSSLTARAHLGLGDLEFSSARFGKALDHYSASLRFQDLPQKGYATYKLAWCLLNLGEQEKAMRTLMSILKDPEMLMAGSGENRRIDQAFHRDVAHDLATFIARQEVSNSEIETLVNLSPDDTAKENLYYLGEETDRLGNKQASLLVWSRYLDYRTTPIEKLEVQIRVAQLHYDLGDKAKAATMLSDATKVWKSRGCKDKNQCEMLKSRVRTFISDWNKSEGRKVTPHLLLAYASYSDLFTDDVDMMFRGALVARSLQNWKVAVEMYHRSSFLARDDLKSAKTKEEKEEYDRLFEASLLGEIEVAELTKSTEMRLEAYNHYLKMNPRGDRIVEVSYQRAMVFYEQKKYQTAAELFTEVAMLRTDKDSELSKKAADLALDSLVLLKNEELLEKSAMQFAGRFPESRAEYITIARKSVLRQTADVIEGKQDSSVAVKSALAKLSRVDLTGATHQEKVALLKNKIILGVKAEDLGAVDEAARQLHSLPGISAEDREYALERQAWAAEMDLNFGKALRISQQMSFPNLSTEQKLLRLALLSELSGLEADRYYNQFISTTRDTDQANEIRAKKVRSARNPWDAFFRNLKIMRQSPNIVAPLALEIYANTKAFNPAQDFLARSIAPRHPATLTLRRLLFLRQFDNLDKKIRSHDITTSNNALLQRSLKQRLDLIASLEKAGSQAVNMRDWTLQLVSVNSISREYDRLYDDLKELPVPAGLNEKQVKQYKAMLKQRALPYLKKAENLKDKIREFWDNDEAIENLVGEYSKAPARLLPALQDELNAIRRIAPADVQRKIARGFQARPDRPSRREIVSARQNLKSDPFSLNRAERLKDIEEASANDTMVAYLEARMLQLRTLQKAAR